MTDSDALIGRTVSHYWKCSRVFRCLAGEGFSSYSVVCTCFIEAPSRRRLALRFGNRRGSRRSPQKDDYCCEHDDARDFGDTRLRRLSLVISPFSFHIESLAVLPFTNVGGDANSEYLSDGITESITDGLTHIPQLKVKSRHSVFQYKGKEVDMQKIANTLGVSAIVSGRVVPRGDRIEVSAELTDVRDNTEIWGQHYSGKTKRAQSEQQCTTKTVS